MILAISNTGIDKEKNPAIQKEAGDTNTLRYASMVINNMI
jgi:hypothetical protein